MSPAETPVRLSVAIIVRDAAEALRETLQSVKPLADEAVVVDTGSQDGSCEVARQFGARLFSHAWQDDFSAARNACLSRVRGAWVLWLDAGERLSAEDAAQLREFVDRSADPSRAYALVVQLPPQTLHAASEQVARIRLVPHRGELRFAGRVRETLEASLDAAGIIREGLPYRILRGPREHDPQSKADKARRNIRLADLQIKEQGPSSSMLNCLGDAFQTLHDHSRAVACFRHALESAERGSVDMLEAYYGLLTSLDNDPQYRQHQLEVAVEASEVFPLDAQLLCAMGGYLQALGRIDLAEKSYHTAFRYGQVNPHVWHLGEVREIAAICQSITLQIQNKAEQAQQVLEAAVAENENSIRLRRQLIEWYVKAGRRDDALAQVQALPQHVAGREALRSAVRGACLAVDQNWIAAKAYLQTAYNAGCREPLCLRWLAATLLAQGQTEEARPVLEQWQQLEPQNTEAAKFLAALQPISQEQPPTETPVTISPPRRWRVDTPTASPTQQPNTAAPTSRHGSGVSRDASQGRRGTQ